jgi:two-component system, OmpR family, phosphate regulon sensor histidine kinase PhoR
LSGWWWAAAWLGAMAALLLVGRYLVGLRRLYAALRRVAHGDLARPLALDLPRGLRAAQRDLEVIARQARDLDLAAHRERAELDAILASIPEGIFTVDRRLCLRQANRGVQAMFRLSASPAGRTVVEAFGHAAMHRLVQEGLQGGQPHRGEITVEQDGTRRVFELSISPLELDADGPGAVVVVHNITRIKGLEQVRRDFVANVSHELRTPLTIINGYLETLVDGGLEDRAMTEKALRVMFKHGDRLGRLVDDLLTISRAESRDVPLETQRLDLPDLLRRVVEQFDEPIRRQDAVVRITTAEGDLSLEADAGRLEQVFLNLLENALKYGNRPGLVVGLYAERVGPNIHVQVTDNGPGIPHEDQEHIFERFYRVHKDRSRETGGTGLGLSIVKNVVQAHGGSVALRSLPGAGSTFTVALPVRQAKPVAPPPWSAAKKTATAGPGPGLDPVL